MCQAYEGEKNYIFAHEKWVRSKGYGAQKNGVPREENPERDHPNPSYSDKAQWWYGWDTAAAGREAW